MFGVTDLWLFVISGLALNMIPGPDSLYIVGRSASQGFKAGSVAALGIGTGTMIHVLAAAFGLSALLATSAMAFTVIKVIGCLYLLYIGASMLFAGNTPQQEITPNKKPMPFSKIFMQGFLTNVLNPKVALFFLAFVPQFIAMDAPDKAFSFIFLGLVFNINGMLWCHFLAWSASAISNKFRKSQRLTAILTKCTGTLFLYFGIRLAFSHQN
ncbi:LysE family translocator [Vibrio mangrovi]|uniref:Leucine efflux protein n=1 Tax=Vibrio mangrovi TaxID=474394 RepID=A0A1Y6INH5_9VIBR|nr:LysE family translocator [Vibrio mangrovi]MDW6003988.1 LysE family translocator [Vibrio mangrovi]SMR99215.1 Leucine efflux protein [Vibrio mangrovi]